MGKSTLSKLFVGFLLFSMLTVTLLLGACTSVPASSPGNTPDPSPTSPAPARAGRISIRWNTADVGSYGYSVASMMVDVLNRELPDKLEGNYVVTIHPFPSTGAAMKSTMDGEGEIAYTADVGMREIWDRTGPYANWNPKKSELVHSFYAYPMETFLAVHKPKAAQYNSWGDLSGKPVYFTPAGFMNWLNMGRIFAALGYEFKHTEIDSGMNADALRDGSIEGSACYTTAGRSLPTYWKETEMRIDIAVVNPSDEERQKLMAAGLTLIKVDPKVAFTKDVGVDEIWGVPILFGYNLLADVPAEFVNAMLEIFEENKEQLVKADKGFTPLAADFVGMQVAGIRANPDIPVHAGMAQYLRAKGVWDNNWIIAE